MTDYSQNVIEYLHVDAGETPNFWGTMLWGDKWREGDITLPLQVEKVISESLTASNTVGKDVFKIIDEQIVFTDQISKQAAIKVTETLELIDGTSDIRKQAGGYDYVFNGGSSDAKDRPNITYTEQAYSTSWNSYSVTSISWTSI